MTSLPTPLPKNNPGNGPAAKPPPMPVLADNIPESLQELPRWLCWSWLWNPAKHSLGGFDKPPLNARTGRKASSTDPATWSTFEAALRAHQRGDFDGIGYVLGDLGDGRTDAGLDLDGVRDPETGVLTVTADFYLGLLNTYTEISPSGRGVKAFCRGTLPRGRRQDEARGVEMYDAGRYFTTTGHRLDRFPAEVMDRGKELRELHRLVFAGREAGACNGRLSDRELALAALQGLSPRRAHGYWDWLAVGMALHSVDASEEMCRAWDEWSQGCPEKYTPGACAAKWATFDGRGLTLGSLVYWAKQDGWRLPGGRTKAGSNGSPDRSPPAGQTPPAAGRDGANKNTGYDLILAYFLDYYQPTFRSGNAIYSARLEREVKPGEACFAPGKALADQLERASDAPIDKHGVARDRIPRFFREWAPSAWRDMVSQAPEEEAAGELADLPAEDFRLAVAEGLYRQVPFGVTKKVKKVVNGRQVEEEHPRQELRSVLDWCGLFARPGNWAKVRSLLVWCRLDDAGRLNIAVRFELFGQLAGSRLGRAKQRKFAALAERYEVGTSKECRPGGARAVELRPEFVQNLLDQPGMTLGPSRPRAREDEDLSSCVEENPCTEGT
jgi:hypothetical protein